MLVNSRKQFFNQCASCGSQAQQNMAMHCLKFEVPQFARAKHPPIMRCPTCSRIIPEGWQHRQGQCVNCFGVPYKFQENQDLLRYRRL